MRDYDPESLFSSLCGFKGSVIKFIWKQLLLVTVISALLATYNKHVAPLNETDVWEVVRVDESGWTLMAFFVAFLLVFRNAMCVGRYNTGRNHLTKLAVSSVELVRKCNFFTGKFENGVGNNKQLPAGVGEEGKGGEALDADTSTALFDVACKVRRDVLALLAFMMIDLRDEAGPSFCGNMPAEEGDLKAHRWMTQSAPALVDSDKLENLAKLVNTALGSEDWADASKDGKGRAKSACASSAIDVLLSGVTALFVEGSEINSDHPKKGCRVLPDRLLREVEKNIIAMHNAYVDANEMVKVLLPFPYVQLMRVFMVLFAFTVPVPLVHEIGYAAIPVSVMLCAGYFGLDEIATQLENPFGTDDNDLPMIRIWNNVERTTRSMLIARWPERVPQINQQRYVWEAGAPGQ